ncbi:MAG: LysR substrate-binding domain-containing protein [Methylobacterium radiotolerans]
MQRGTVSLRCGAGFLIDLLDNALAGFAQDHPGIAYQVEIGTTDGILAAIARGDADIGLVYNPPAHPDVRGIVSAPAAAPRRPADGASPRRRGGAGSRCAASPPNPPPSCPPTTGSGN